MRSRYQHRHRLRGTTSQRCWLTRVGTVNISTKYVRDHPVLPNVAGRATAGRSIGAEPTLANDQVLDHASHFSAINTGA